MLKLFRPKYLLFLITGLLFSHTLQDPSLNNALVYDIMSSTTVDLDLETELWTFSGLTGSSKSFTCNSILYLGGKGAVSNGGYFQRVYTGLPTHNIVYFSIQLVVVDLWNPTDSFSVYMDDRLVVNGWNPGTSVSGFPGNLCGDATYDLGNIYAVGKIFHTQSTLSLKIVFNLNSSPLTGGLGFRLVNLFFAQKSSGEQEVSACATVQTGTVQGVPVCANPYGEYLDSSSAPNTCVFPCSLCSTASDCFVISIGRSFDGYQPFTCATGCAMCFGSNSNQCNVCSGTPSTWNYWDYTCRSTCNPPNIQEGANIRRCLAPCQSQGTFTLWDNTCSDTCDSPLQQRIAGRAKFCDFPCPANNIVFPDGTCSTTLSCDAPANLITIAGNQICKHPCETITDFYYERGGSCKSTCEYPYTVESTTAVQVCVLELDASAAAQAQQVANTTSIGGFTVKVAGMALSFLNANNAGLLFMAALAGILQYIRYLDIKYPPKLELMLEGQQENLDKMAVFKIPSAIDDAFPEYILPDVYKDNGLQSSFFINSWQTIFTFVLVIVILVLVCILEAITKNSPKVRSILSWIRSSLQWNMILSIFCGAYGTFGLYTFLELRVIMLKSTASGLSLLANVLMNGIGILILITILRICNNFQMMKKLSSSFKNNAKKSAEKVLEGWKRYEVLFEGYRDSSFAQQIFLFVFMARTYVHSAIIALFNDYPFQQTVSLTVISVIMILYLILKRPLESILEFIEQLSCEIAILIVNICITILAAMDRWTVGTLGSRESLGNGIIGIQIALTAFILLLMVIELILFIKKIWSLYRTGKSKSQGRELIQSKTVDLSNSSIQLRLSNPKSRMNIENNILDQSLEKSREISPISGGSNEQIYFQQRAMRRRRRREQEKEMK